MPRPVQPPSQPPRWREPAHRFQPFRSLPAAVRHAGLLAQRHPVGGAPLELENPSDVFLFAALDHRYLTPTAPGRRNASLLPAARACGRMVDDAAAPGGHVASDRGSGSAGQEEGSGSTTRAPRAVFPTQSSRASCACTRTASSVSGMWPLCPTSSTP
jgi:hypothetical protein